jgi:hypothetical protein
MPAGHAGLQFPHLRLFTDSIYYPSCTVMSIIVSKQPDDLELIICAPTGVHYGAVHPVQHHLPTALLHRL